MAKRPVFIVSNEITNLIKEEDFQFKWNGGFAKSQKQKNIINLHEAFNTKYANKKVLEISTSSTRLLGVNLSAFRLLRKDEFTGKICTIECEFQSSKKFENGGPYKDLLDRTSLEAKRDERLKTSGKLVAFIHNDIEWELEPKTHFYDWLYLNALRENKELKEEVLKYDAFTDIEFNPMKSINCQAKSAALFVALSRLNIIDEVLSSRENYLKFIKEEESQQISLF